MACAAAQALLIMQEASEVDMAPGVQTGNWNGDWPVLRAVAQQ